MYLFSFWIRYITKMKKILLKYYQFHHNLITVEHINFWKAYLLRFTTFYEFIMPKLLPRMFIFKSNTWNPISLRTSKVIAKTLTHVQTKMHQTTCSLFLAIIYSHSFKSYHHQIIKQYIQKLTCITTSPCTKITSRYVSFPYLFAVTSWNLYRMGEEKEFLKSKRNIFNQNQTTHMIQHKTQN